METEKTLFCGKGEEPSMKNTRQRAAILRVLDESAEPLSAD